MPRREHTGWAIGWTLFAAIAMGVIGAWWITVGIVSLDDGEFFAKQNFTFRFSTTAWGWIHLITGVLTLAAGFGLFMGKK